MSSISSRPLASGGFTLIELLLYVSLLGMLLTGVTMFFASSLTARVKNQSIAEVDRQGTLAMEYITQAFRNASSITSPAAGANAATTTIAMPTASLNPTIISLNTGVLQASENGTVFAFTNSKVTVSSLSFKNLTRTGTPGIMQISFVVSRNNATNRTEYDYQKTFTSSAALR